MHTQTQEILYNSAAKGLSCPQEVSNGLKNSKQQSAADEGFDIKEAAYSQACNRICAADF